MTERKRVEQALRESEEKYRHLVERAKDGIAIVQDEQIKYLNPAILETMGYTEDEIIGRPFTAYIDRAELPKVAEYYRKRMAGEDAPAVYETVILHKNGSKIFVEVNVGLITYQSKPAGFVFVHDITERRKAQDILRESESELAIIFESSPLLMMLLDEKTNILRVNRATEIASGRASEELTGIPGGEAMRCIHHLDAEEGCGFGPVCQSCTIRNTIVDTLRTGKPHYQVEADLYVNKADEEKKLVFLISTAVIEVGRKRRVLVTLQDITDRKRAEEDLSKEKSTLRRLIDLNPYSISIFDALGHFVTGNQAFLDLFKSAPPPEYCLFDDPILKRSGLKEKLHKLKKGEVIGIDEISYNPKDIYPDLSDAKIYIRAVIFPTFNSKGEIENLVAMSEDITKRKQAEEALKQSEDRFRQLAENFRDALILFDTAGKRNIYVNPMAEKLFGLSREAILEMEPGEFRGKFVHDEDREKIREFYVRAVQTRKSGSTDVLDCEYRIRRPDGEVRWCHQRSYPQTSLGEIGSRFYMIVSDITERKKAEEALKESEEKFRTLAEESPNMIFIYGKGRVLYVNKKSAEMMGYEREEFYAPDFDFMALIAPESKELVRENLAIHMQGREVDPYEYSLIAKDGRRIEAILTTKLIAYEGTTAILGISTDITERKKAEEALKESEEKYRSIFELSPEAIVLVDTKGTVLACNKKINEWLGYEPDELIGKKFTDLSFLTEETVTRIKENFASRLSGEDIAPYEVEYKAKDGKSIIGRVVGTPVKDVDGKVIGDLAMISDITERKRAEEALKESEEKFRNLADLLPLTVFEIDLEGNLTYTNRTGKEAFGYTDEEVSRGLNVFNLFVAENAEEIKKGIDVIVHGGEPRGVEYLALRKDGSTFPALIYSNLVVEDGHPAGLRGIVIDVTERKAAEEAIRESEARFLDLYHSAPVAYFSVGTDGTIKNANKAAQVLTGYTAEQLEKMKVFDIYAEETRSKAQDLLDKLKQGHGWENEEMVYLREDGQKIHGLLSVSPIKDQTGKVTESRSVVVDITDRKRAEDRERRHVQNLAFLSNTAMDFVAQGPDEDVYAYIAAKLKEMAGEAIIGIASYDETSGEFSSRAVVGLGEKAQKVLKILGKDPRKMESRVSEEVKARLVEGELTSFFGSLHQLTGGAIPQGVSTALEKTLGIGDIYAMGFTRKNDLLGAAFLVLPRGEELSNEEVIEAFINQASVAVQRRRIEEALLESEDKFRNVVERANDGISVSRGVVLTYVNPRLAGMLGYEVDEMIGTPFSRYVHPDFLDEVKERHRQRQAGQPTPAVYETRLRKKDGEIIDVEVNAGVVTYAAEVVGISIIRDITERKLTEKALRESEERFRNVIESSPIGVHILEIDSQGRLVFTGANQAADMIFGVDHQRYIGKPLEEADPSVTKTEIPKKYRKIALQGESWQTEQVVYEGGLIKLAVDIHAFQTSPGKMVAMFRDITQHKRYEEVLQRRVDESGAISSLTRKLLTAESVSQVVEVAVAELSGIFPHYVSVNLIDDEGRNLVVEGQKVEKGLLSFAEKLIGRKYVKWKIPLTEEGPISQTMRTGHPTVIGLDFEPTEEVVETDMVKMLESMVESKSPLRKFAAVIAKNLDHLSMLGIPFTNSSGDIMGSITVLSSMRFNRDDFNMVKVTADVIGQAIEKQTTSAALRTSEERYRALTDGALIGIYIYSDEGYVFVNPAMAEITGYSREELLEIDPYQLALPQDVKLLKDREKSVKQGKKIPSRYTVRIRRKDGEMRVLAVRTRYVEYQGRLAALGNCIDITEQVRQRQQLERAREEWERTFNAASDLMMIVDISGHLVKANKAVIDYLGIDSSELLTLNVAGVFHLDSTEDIGSSHLLCLQSGETQYIEVEDNQTERVFLISLSPFLDQDGEVIGTVDVARDVTAMRHMAEALAVSEAQFRGIAESARDIIFNIDFAGKILYVNPASEDILGYKPDETIGINLVDTPISSEKIRQTYEDMIKTIIEKSQLPLLEIELKDRFGRRHVLEISARKTASSIVGIARDVSERKRMEEQLIRTSRLASLGVLVGGIAHQLNNPLAVMMSASAVLQNVLMARPDFPEDIKEKLVDYAETMDDQIERTRKIVAGLLAFAQDRKAEIRPSNVNLQVKKVLQLLSEHFAPDKVRLELSLAEELPQVQVDPEALEQVIVNVAQNAVEAMQGAGELIISTCLADNDVVRISITDNGPGIPEEFREDIFDPLFTTKADGAGTGLGLSLVVMLLERFDGRIYLEDDSGPDSGARFVIEIPASEKGE